MISLDGVDPKPDQKINKKKAREIINLADKVVVSNYDCPRGTKIFIKAMKELTFL